MHTASALQADTAPATRPISILVVEDQEVLRLGLRLSLSDADDIVIVGEAGDGPAAVRMAAELQPALILMDIGLPGFDGVVATKKIKMDQDARVLVLSSHSEEKSIYAALEAGADGYCLKDTSKNQLISAIRSVAQGGTWLSNDIAEKMFQSLRAVDPEATNQHAALNTLELRILNSIFEGSNMIDICQELNLSQEEVLGYTTRVLQKIAVKKPAEDGNDSGKKRRITGEHVLSRICSRCYEHLPLDSEECPFDGSAADIDELVGTVFADRYEILSVLGSGSGGTVYKARHRFMHKLVAIKLLHGEHLKDLDLLRRFRQEATSSSVLQHPNIVSVLDFGFSSQGEPFMIMDYLDCYSLATILEGKSYLEPGEAIPIFLQICDGLEVAHQHGIIHRDLKPGNILVSGFGTESINVRLADFGIAKITRPLVEGDLVKTDIGQVFGSPLYMSPEQCRGEDLDPSSDIFSMGCVMYETLVGHPPVVGKNAVEVMYKRTTEKTPHIGGTERGATLPALLQEAVMKALRDEKYDRYRRIGELKTLLTGLVF
ncbi:MAG: protein kinase [Cyanobacteria bacterium HKST-UBA02]|nr:protein kinase [Cyanobacteria bacterium HKST-UBA02]